MEFNYDQLKEKIKDYDIQTKIQLIALAQCLYDRKQLDHQQDQELDKMESDYKKTVEPLVEAQNQIISGQKIVSAEEIGAIADYLNPEETPIENKEPIQNYWCKVLKNSSTLKSEVIGDKDEPLLQSITNIKGLDDKEKNTVGLIFQFKPNEYFEEEELKVEFILDEKSGEPQSVTSSKITWKAGKNITVKLVKKKNKKKKEVEQQSFFLLFRTLDTKEWEKLEEDKKEEQQHKLDMCYDICRLIYDEILPYSLEYYLDVHVEDDNYDGDDLDDDEDDEDDEELTKEEAIRRMKEKRGFKK